MIVLEIRGGMLKDVLGTGCKTALDVRNAWMFFSPLSRQMKQKEVCESRGGVRSRRLHYA